MSMFSSDYKAQLFSPSSPYPSDCVITLKDNKEVHAQKGFLFKVDTNLGDTHRTRGIAARILSLHSEYFKNIFANDITSTISLDTVDYDDFVNLLAIIYPTLHSITVIPKVVVRVVATTTITFGITSGG
ncbi:BTB/POZ domain-containing protein [Ditylenchus destructor]|nr:BTB/POZ domain-containing protein [Ditylenchus destructor]